MQNETIKRPPIVTILGHVDHGKTTLLDSLKNSRIAAKEAGGITQNTYASVIETKSGNQMTFVDTPGHAVFSKMRERGAKIADIALLIVALDDGVKPQTKEALTYLISSETPFIVTFNKKDSPKANKEMAMSQLEAEGILFEGRGGSTPFIEISAKNKEGLDELIELVYLLYELQEKKETGELEAYVLETKKDKKGPTVLAIVKNGVLKTGEEIWTESEKVKIRGMFDENERPIKEVKAGHPAVILGFSSLPEVGTKLTSTVQQAKTNNQVRNQNQHDENSKLKVIIKAQSQGSLEAIVGSIQKEILITGFSVGEITESEILHAKTTGSEIITFECKNSQPIVKFAQDEGVKITNFTIIYELLEYLQKHIDDQILKINSKALVLDVFPFNNKKVAGIRAEIGKIRKNDKFTLMREEKEIGKVRITSVRKGKNEVAEIIAPEECGVLFEPQLDFQKGDMLISYEQR